MASTHRVDLDNLPVILRPEGSNVSVVVLAVGEDEDEEDEEGSFILHVVIPTTPPVSMTGGLPPGTTQEEFERQFWRPPVEVEADGRDPKSGMKFERSTTSQWRGMSPFGLVEEQWIFYPALPNGSRVVDLDLEVVRG